MDRDLLADCEIHAPRQYEPVIQRLLRTHRNIGQSCERPFSASRRRVVRTIFIPEEKDDIREKKGKNPLPYSLNRLRPVAKIFVSQTCTSRFRDFACDFCTQPKPREMPQIELQEHESRHRVWKRKQGRVREIMLCPRRLKKSPPSVNTSCTL